MDASEQVIPARIRTLLALERNYLAEERTALAEFRTGLAIAVVAPSASAVVAYIFAFVPSDTDLDFSLLVFAFLGILTIIGVLTSIRSQSRLKKIRKHKEKLKDHEDAIIKSSKAAHDLLGELIDLDDG